MHSGSTEIRKALESDVPLSAGEQRKSWFFRVSAHYGIDASRIRSLFYDTRCRLTDRERARLEVISDHIQKVHCVRHQLSQRQEDVYADTIRRLEEVCRDLREKLERSNKAAD